MYVTVVLSIIDDVLKTDQNILFEFLGIIDRPIGDPDIVGVVIQNFKKYEVVEILTLAIEAGLI